MKVLLFFSLILLRKKKGKEEISVQLQRVDILTERVLKRHILSLACKRWTTAEAQNSS
jgi:hypothetical protein